MLTCRHAWCAHRRFHVRDTVFSGTPKAERTTCPAALARGREAACCVVNIGRYCAAVGVRSEGWTAGYPVHDHTVGTYVKSSQPIRPFRQVRHYLHEERASGVCRLSRNHDAKSPGLRRPGPNGAEKASRDRYFSGSGARVGCRWKLTPTRTESPFVLASTNNPLSTV